MTNLSDGKSEKKSHFVEAVYVIVQEIPRGRVTTYGRIAETVGAAKSARMVGWTLHNSPDDISENAHRVVNRNGELTGGWSWGHPDIMRALLEEEGVTFIEEYIVDLQKHLWDPRVESSLAGKYNDPMD